MTAMVEGLTPLATGFCFGEGPRWFEGLLWFSDMLGEAVHTVTLSGSMTTLPLPGHSPSGLGFRPDGSLLIVSAEDRRLLGYDGETVDTVADLSALAPADLGDMVVDNHGRAYIGSQAFNGGVILRVDPDDTVSVVARDLDFPNGMAITPDHRTLIVAESIGRRSDRVQHRRRRRIVRSTSLRRWLDGPPDGICLDAEGGVWTAMTLAHQFERIEGRRRQRARDASDRHRRSRGDRLHARRIRGPHAVHAVEQRRLPQTPDRYPAVPGRHGDRGYSCRRRRRER